MSIKPIEIWICWLLALSGVLSYEDRRPSTEAASIAGHKVVKVYDMNMAEWRRSWPSHVLPDWAGKICIAYAQGGITLFDRATEKIIADLGGNGSEKFDPASNLYAGKDGLLWYLSHGTIRTVLRYNGEWIEAAVPEDGALGPPSGLFQDQDRNLWFMTRRHGLVYHNGHAFSGPMKPGADVESSYRALLFPGYAADKQPQVVPLEGESRAVSESGQGFRAADGLIWLSASRAVVTFDQRAGSWKIIRLPPGLPGFPSLCEGRRGTVWFCGPIGQLATYDRAEGRWSMIDLLGHLPASNSDDSMTLPHLVHGIYLDRSGTIMIPTNRGLVTFNPELNKWESFTSTNSALPDSYLTGITEDAEGRIWLTERSGIVVLDP
jgi:streptogramin lyase